MQPSAEQLQLYFSGKYRHTGYAEATRLAAELRMHADGTYPEHLIDERRPNESVDVKDYRRKIWKPITKPYVHKVLNSLQKIRRSTEWSVRFPAQRHPRIADNERLEDYLMYRFPHFTSITNWAFELLLKEYAVDANAWVSLSPHLGPPPVGEEARIQFGRNNSPLVPSPKGGRSGWGLSNAYPQPYPVIFRSEQIVEAVPDRLLVAMSEEQSVYKEDGVQKLGDCYYVLTDEVVQRWEQTRSDRTFALAWEVEHRLGYLPAFQMKGMVKHATGSPRAGFDGAQPDSRAHSSFGFIKESRLAPMLPRFDEALREYSDLQAEVVQHIFSEKWEYGQEECGECRGKRYKFVPGYGSRKEDCAHCKGTGWEPRGPYTVMKVAKPMAGETATPTPPMGYVQKNTSIVTTQDARIERHIWHGLAAVNMEFLVQKPLTESGVAKAYDADETNNFVHAVAEDIVAMLDAVAMMIADLRYGYIVPDAGERRAMLPQIMVPERFDIFSAQMVEEELAKAKTHKVHPLILNAMEVAYASRKFGSTEPGVRDLLALTLTLDPMANVSEADKMLRFQNKWVRKEDCIISANIYGFVQRALEERGDAFYAVPVREQRALMEVYAAELMVNPSVAGPVAGDEEILTPGTEPGLRQSGAGITGMIALAKAVDEGVMSEEAAAEIVKEQYGVSVNEAEEMAGG